MNDQEYEELLFQPLKSKYPHITIKVNRTDPEKLAAAGEFPDIFYVANVRYYVFKNLDIPYDMSELVKKSGLNLNAFSNPNMDWIRELGPNGEVFGLPFDLNHYALFYNKDIFDKRGVPYPKDGMTWEDLLELSRKLTFAEGNVQYRGFVPPGPNVFSGTRTMPVYDPLNKKALLNDSRYNYKSILELVKSFYDIPGIIVNNQYPINGADFIKDQNVAMYANWITDTASRMQKENVKMNFDIVGMPSFSDLPGVTIHSGAKMMGISKTSKYKEDAFLAIEFFTSPEVQKKINRGGRLTALADESIRRDFAADVEVLKGKNIAGALSVKPAKMIPPHEYNAVIDGKLNATVADLAKGTKDINTLLREAQEAADKAIAEAEAMKK
jgi:multiple sugar transport system substrate-binding protein